ncbi:DEKNAAC102885 [Brettanomyces naardenensis]|uniref:Elongator complex protein 1 n=1 Tax=Brettanomyces naardenensis TaxID=13370 RepID=A0A448YLK2_BRENA|nr:DEKNAAC102885 [Brettanomyces naardenensis]
MRNLRVLNRGTIRPESRTFPDLNVLASSFDAITDSITVVLGSEDSDTLEAQQFLKDGSIRVLASFPVKLADPIVSFAHFPDLMELVFIFASGDIITANYSDNGDDDPDSTIVQIVGSIDAGISCASWSLDEESLALLTGESNIVLLSRTFEPIAETKLESSDLHMTTQVSLGWGKKETQFRGKGARQIERQRLVLKHAGLNLDSDTAVLHDPTVKEAEYGTLTSYDDGKSCQITWRGDCKHFAVINVHESPLEDHTRRRVVRVYSRDGKLESCSEPIDGMEGAIAWKPQGSLIACVQRSQEVDEDDGEQFEALKIIFLERNGLRHGEFNTRLPEGSKIDAIDWSANSEVLALQFEHSVQIWATKNYHWYLKQEIIPPSGEPILFARFHPDKSLRIMVGTQSAISVIDMAYCISSGPTASPHDIGMTLVADGTTCMVTPLARARVPPPVGFREVYVDEPIVDIAVSQSNELFAIVTNEFLYITKVSLGEVISPVEIVSKVPKSLFCEDDHDQPRQVAISGSTKVCVLYDSQSSGSMLAVLDVTDNTDPKLVSRLSAGLNVVSLSPTSTFDDVTYECVDGSVHLLDGITLGKFPQFCSRYSVAQVDSDLLIPFGITDSGKLFVGNRLLCSGVTSMLLTDSFLLYTTAQHELKFMHLKNNHSLLDETQPLEIPDAENAESSYDERARMIERGSWLVSAVPSQAFVTLQAPRGNLETIYPRIMVLSGVRSDIKSKHYRSAFLACRTHRIALDILHDYDPISFFNHIEQFINELGKVEYLDLFLSCLLEEDVAKTKYRETSAQEEKLEGQFKKLSVKVDTPADGKISKICDAILEVLLTPKYESKYLQSIITAYACQKPPKTEKALELIESLNNASETEKCVQHLCFLLDVNKLYDVALGIYNIPLALVIAQQSQKDPKEYLPFLQELHVQKDNRKRFMVDTYLKKYEKALDSLRRIDVEEEENIENEILTYIVNHQLYKHALQIYRYDSIKFDIVLRSYADYLCGSQKHSEAALAYDKLGQYGLALDEYVKGRKWKQAISIGLRPEFRDQLTETAEKLVAILNEAHEYSSAAYIEFKYLRNIKESLRLYCKDYEFEQAIMLCYEENQVDLVKEVVDPSLGEQFGIVAELLADCNSQVVAQLKRLRELREKKEEDPFAFYGGNAENTENADNVSIAQTESTLRSSIFTRYTGKTSGTAKTGASRRTAKNRRREERKRARGKKGTIYEEEYLVRSTSRLVERLNDTVSDADKLVEGLVRRNMMEQAHQIQGSFMELIEFVRGRLVEIYSISEKDRERENERGEIYLVPEIEKPILKDFPKKEMLEY